MKQGLALKSKFLLSFLAFLGLFFLGNQVVNAQEVSSSCQTITAQLTGYYTPIPGQSRYALGTFAADVRMNGDTITANGTEVGPTTIAAPRSYPFGTQIVIPQITEGIGGYTGVVVDRGGAIKVYGGVPRFDLWMGYGDEGLNRALQLGKRTVPVQVCGIGAFTIDLSPAIAPLIASSTTSNINEVSEIVDVELSRDEIRQLQQFLLDMGVYTGTVSGVRGLVTEAALERLQVNISRIEATNHGQPGLPLKYAHESCFDCIRDDRRYEFVINKVPQRTLGRGAHGSEVLKLQETLQLLGYKVDLNGIYDQSTVDAVANFQEITGMLKQLDSNLLGYFDSLTQTKMLQETAKFDYLAVLELRSEYQPEVEKGQKANKMTIRQRSIDRALEDYFSFFRELAVA